MITQRIGKIKLRRGTVTQLVEIILEEGELVFLVDKERYMIGDGSTYGGISVTNRSYIVNSYGIPSTAMYGDIIYNTNNKTTFIVGYDLSGKILELFEICSYGKLLLLQERLADLFNKIRPLTGFLIQNEPKTPPYITRQPISQVIDRTLNATFSLTAEGSPTLSYQWYKNNIPILSTNNASYTINNIQYSDAGSFYCKITNSYGYTESNIITLQVTSGVAPLIITHPLSQTLNNGLNATFSVSANGGGYALSFQWYKNNLIINGETNSNFTLTNITSTDEANYKCIVTNRFSSVNSDQAYLKVNVGTIPIVTTHPVSVNKNNGLTAIFNVVANGNAPITYQWYKNDVLITGATSDLLILTNITSNDVAAYKCKVENSFGSIFSNSANLTVNIGTAPVITVQPKSQIINNGLNYTFNVVATGTPTLIYQWYKDNVAITEATNSNYSIVNATGINDGTYKCIVTNSFGDATSDDATLTVNIGTVPVITTQPISLNKNNGLIASFNVVANGSAPLTYQWYKDNVAITGSTTNSYTIASVVAGDAGNYKCIVSNGFGSVVSNIVSLTVNVGSAPIITTQPISRTLNNGLAATFTVIATGTAPLTYQWYKNGTNLISGATSSTYTVTNVSSTDEGTYKCVVSNSFGTVTSTDAVLKVNIGFAPSIITQPVAKSLLVSTPTNVTFDVVAAGTPTLTYQWYKDNVIISGATSSTYTINNVAKTDEGGYKCIATNTFDSAESNVATLTLSIGDKPVITTQPTGQTYIEGKSPVTYSVTSTGTSPLTYQWFGNGAAILGATNNTFVINSKTPTYSKLKCKVTNIYGEVFSNEVDHKNVCKIVVEDPVQYGYIMTELINKKIANIDELAYDTIKGYYAKLVLGYTKALNSDCGYPETTKIYKNNILVKTETVKHSPSLSIQDTNWQNLTGEYIAVFSNAANTVSSGKLIINPLLLTPPTIVTQPVDQLTSGSAVTFSVSAIGSEPLTYQWKSNTIDIVGENKSVYNIPNPKNIYETTTNITCKVTNDQGSVLSNSAILKVGIKPSIITQPISQSINKGSKVSMSVVATGSLPFAFQWNKDGTVITGATSDTYTINSAALSDAGSYTCTVSNIFGIVTSNNAVLTVNNNFDAGDLIISADTYNFVLKDALITKGWDTTLPVVVNVIVNSGVTVGSNSTALPSFKVDAFPTGSVIKLTNNGNIVGKGGDGGTGGGAGEDGGNAIETDNDITITNNNLIGGGGGGGGSTTLQNKGANHVGGGGGGAGALLGKGGRSYVSTSTSTVETTYGSDGTLLKGGGGSGSSMGTNANIYAGSGGDLGQKGNGATARQNFANNSASNDSLAGVAIKKTTSIFLTLKDNGTIVGKT
jgi:hypothetical protein